MRFGFIWGYPGMYGNFPLLTNKIIARPERSENCYFVGSVCSDNSYFVGSERYNLSRFGRPERSNLGAVRPNETTVVGALRPYNNL